MLANIILYMGILQFLKNPWHWIMDDLPSSVNPP
jgi:hypothetical protein